MHAHFANQIGQKTIRTPNAAAFRRPARQYVSGRLEAFTIRMGRVAIPLVKQYVMPVAKEFGKNFYRHLCRNSQTSTRVGKDQRLCWGKHSKKALQKPLLRPPPPPLQKESTLAHIHQKNQLQVYLRLCDRLPRRGGRAGE